MPIYYYHLPKVNCGNCTGTIDTALKASPLFGNQTFFTDANRKMLTIESKDEQLGYLAVRDELNKVLDKVGFRCEAVDESSQPSLSQRWLSHHVLGGVGISVGVLFMLAMMLAGPLPLVVTAMMAGLSVPLTLFLGAESYQNALKKGKLGQLTMDTLFSISTLTILLVSSAAFFFPTLPMMFDAGLLIFGFRHMGIAIKDSFNHTTFKSLNFQDDAPREVLKYVKGNELETTRVLLAEIQPGDTLLLAAGAIIPLDGRLVSGSGLILDTIITGNSQPRSVKDNELLYAGIQLMQVQSPLVFRVEHSAANSHLAYLDKQILRAKAEKAALETATSRIIQYFIPAVVCLAIVSGVLIACFFSNALAIQCAVSVLVSACPCTLGMITPLAVHIGMRKTTEKGIAFKSAKALEAADNIQCIVFDLNGTLTRGEPVVARYQALLPAEEMPYDLLDLFAHLEGECKHPTAKAIRDAANTTTSLEGDIVVESDDHSGLVVRWQEKIYTLGSAAMMIKHGVEADALMSLGTTINPEADNTIVYLACEGKVIGYVVLHDPLRDDAINVVKTLKDSGKEVHLCTGADLTTAERYANLLGIDQSNVRANCVSNAAVDAANSKKNYLDTLKKDKGFRVAAVGDAGNDAEMIAASDVGFAMNAEGGNPCTQETADAVIQGQALSPILHAFAVAEHMVTNIKQNLIFSLVYNIAAVLVTGGLLLTIGVVLNPAIGAALMMLQTSLILLNVRRFSTQQTCMDAEFVPDSPSQADTNVSGHGNSMRLTHSNRQGCDQREGLFDQCSNLLRHGFYKLKCSGLNKVDHELAESRVVNRGP